MSGTGRRRKPNPDEEGSLPAPPRAPGGYPQPQQPQPPSEYDYDQGYAYDWRQPPSAAPQQDPYAAQQDPYSAQSDPYAAQPPYSTQSDPYAARSGPVFDAFSSSGTVSPEQSGYYNPAGHTINDPYSPSHYTPVTPPHPTPYQPSSAQQQRPTTSPPPPSVEPAGLFDENDLFDTGSSLSASASTTPAAPPTSPAPASTPNPAVPSPVVPPPAEDAPRPQDGYTPADFAFLEEDTGHDVKNWLTFVETRAESRADRLKQFRVRLIGLGVAVALVAAGIGAYFLFHGGPLGAQAVTKSVILLQVSDSTGNAVADALLVTDRSGASGSSSAKTAAGKGAAVLIPSQLVVNTTGFGAQPFGGNMAQSVPAAGKDTIADVLGVTIDGVWRMDKVTFAGLIDEIGGIKLTATTAVPAATGSPTAAAIPAGAGKLTGGQAVAYGTYTAKGESPTAQSERFGQVAAGLLGALPTDAGAITAYLNHLGVVDDPSLPESRLSPILSALAAEEQAGSFTAKALPLRTDGSDELDPQAAAPIVSGLLGGALSASSPGQVERVLVEDASGHTGMESQTIRGAAQAKLSNDGYTFLDGSTVATRSTSVVEVATQDRKQAATQIAQALGLQAGSVQVVPGLTSIGDATVLLGTDWPGLAGVQLTPGG